MLGERNEIVRACEEADIDAERLPSILRATQNWIGRLRAESEVASALAELVERVVLSRDGMQVTLKLPLLPTSDHSGVNPSHLSLARFVPLQMKRRGVELRWCLKVVQVPAELIFPCLERSHALADGLTN